MTRAQKEGLYRRIHPAACTLSIAALEMCAIEMRPASTYKLYVPKLLAPFARMTAKHIGATSLYHPFASHINVIESDKLEPHEWYIEGESGDAWGSEGL